MLGEASPLNHDKIKFKTCHSLEQARTQGGGGVWGVQTPPFGDDFFFFFFFFACHPGGRRTVHMYPYPLN